MSRPHAALVLVGLSVAAIGTTACSHAKTSQHARRMGTIEPTASDIGPPWSKPAPFRIVNITDAQQAAFYRGYARERKLLRDISEKDAASVSKCIASGHGSGMIRRAFNQGCRLSYSDSK